MRPGHLFMISPRLLVYGIALAAAVAFMGALWVHGDRHGRAAVQAKWDKAELDAQTAWGIRESGYRAAEQESQRIAKEVSDDLHGRLEKTKADELDLRQRLAAAGTDAVRLRERFKGCAAPQSVSASGAAVGGNDAARTGGLSTADQEFLVRIGAECDATAHRLAALQKYTTDSCGGLNGL